MDGVILCAGKGRRVAHQIGNSQKCMIRIDGKPMIHHTLESFESIDVDTVYFVVGYNSQEVTDYFSGISGRAKIRFVYDPEFEVDLPARSLSLLEDFISPIFFYSHGEILYDRILVEQIRDTELKDKSAIIALSPDLTVAPAHQRAIIKGDKVEDLCLFPIENKSRYPFSYIGVARLNKSVFPYLRGVSGLTHALSAMLREGHSIGYVLYEGEWKHISTPEDLMRLRSKDGK
jgi:NDP-sugar pyrophosphorylase family protein